MANIQNEDILSRKTVSMEGTMSRHKNYLCFCQADLTMPRQLTDSTSAQTYNKIGSFIQGSSSNPLHEILQLYSTHSFHTHFIPESEFSDRSANYKGFILKSSTSFQNVHSQIKRYKYSDTYFLFPNQLLQFVLTSYIRDVLP